MTLISGVDAGGSHTEAVVGDGALKELGRGRSGPGTLRPGELAASVAAIKDAIGSAVARFEERHIKVLVIGAAGTKLPADRDALTHAMRETDVAETVIVTSDATVALEAAFPDEEPGILLSGGTGSIAHGRTNDGTVHCVGGWGWRFGDEGSGFWLGQQAAMAAIRSFEKRSPQTSLGAEVLRATGVEDLSQFRAWTRDATVRDIAALAQVVEDVARDQDQTAQSLVKKAAEFLIRHVDALLPRFEGEEAVTVAFHGGLLRRETLVRVAVLDALERRSDRIQFSNVDVDPALGALRMAGRLAKG